MTDTTTSTTVTATAPESQTFELAVPGAVLRYDVREGGAADQPPLMMIGSPMGAGRLHHPRRALPRPDGRHLRPARGRAQRAQRPEPDLDPAAARRRPAPRHRGARPRSGRPGGQQRGSGQRPRAGGAAPGRRPHPGGARAAAGGAGRGPRGRPGRLPGHPRHLPARRHGPGDGQVHRDRLPHRPGARRLRRPARGPRGVRAPHRGRRFARRRAARSEPAVLHRPRARHSTRSRPRRRGSSSRVGEASQGQLARRGGEAVAARIGVPVTVFPGDHAGFLGGEYGQTGVPDEFAARLREVLAG